MPYIYAAQKAQEKYKNKGKRHLELQFGQDILLSTRNLRALSSRKFRIKFMDPFRILKKFSAVFYKLNLHISMQHLYPMFYVSFLCPYTLEKDGRALPEAIRIDREELFEVETILKQRTFKRRPHYLVCYQGFASSKDIELDKDDLIEPTAILEAIWNHQGGS